MKTDRTERIAAALNAIKERVEKAEQERNTAREHLDRVRSRVEAIKGNLLYVSLPSWVKTKIEEIFDRGD